MQDNPSNDPNPVGPGGPPPVPPRPPVPSTSPVPPRYAPEPVRAPPSRTPGWLIAVIVGAVCLFGIAIISIMAGLLLPALSKAKQRAQMAVCENHLAQLGMAFRVWEADHNGRLPFDVSTNSGGTKEWVLRGADGYDQNSWMEFQALSVAPQLLVCPGDRAHVAAADIGHLTAANVSYQIHPAAGISSATPSEILVYCPVHHTVLLVDGSVHVLTSAEVQLLQRRAQEHSF